MKKILIAIAVLAVPVLSSQAAVIANYDFEGNVATSIINPTGATAGDVGVGSGLNLNLGAGAGGDILGGNSNGFGFTLATTAGVPTTLADAFAADDYITFTVTPDAGNSIEFTTLDFDIRVNAVANGINEYAVFSSVDGFASTADAFETGAITVAAATTAVSQIDLSGLGPVTSATEFRIYVYGSSVTGNSNTGSDYDNIVLQGTVVPEPSSAALLGLGGLAFILRRRR